MCDRLTLLPRYLDIDIVYARILRPRFSTPVNHPTVTVSARCTTYTITDVSRILYYSVSVVHAPLRRILRSNA